MCSNKNVKCKLPVKTVSYHKMSMKKYSTEYFFIKFIDQLDDVNFKIKI